MRELKLHPFKGILSTNRLPISVLTGAAEVLTGGALPIHTELFMVAESRGGYDHIRRDHQRRLKTSAIEGRILDECPANHRADRRRFGIHHRRGGFRRDALRRRTQRHFELDFEREIT